MSNHSKKDTQLIWIYRIFVTLDIILIISGYISYYQTNYQLTSPLIPKSTIDVIMNDNGLFKASIVTSIPFLAGILVWSFNKKTAAIILLILSVLVYKVVTL